MSIVSTLNQLRINASITALETVTQSGAVLNTTVTPSEIQTYSNGVGIGQNNVFYYNPAIVLAPSGTLTLDLLNAGSALLDFYDGVLLPFARVKVALAYFYNLPGFTASSITIGGGSDPFVGPWPSAGFTMYTGQGNSDGVCDQFGRARNDATGWIPVTATSNNVKITNNDASNSAQLLLLLAGCNL